MQIVLSVLAAVAYALAAYFKNLSASGEKFDSAKFIRTVLIGFVVGIASKASGIEVTEENILELSAGYAGAVAVLENLVKLVYNVLKKKQ